MSIIIVTPAGRAAFAETITAADEARAHRFLRRRAAQITDDTMSDSTFLHIAHLPPITPSEGSSGAYAGRA